MVAQALSAIRHHARWPMWRRGANRNGVFGHLNLYLRDRLVLEGRELDPNIGPLFGTIGAETQAHGGYAFHAHGGYALEIWADLVQRATNGVELLQFGIYRGIGLDGWYHVLNAGFRFPGYGASDYPACRKLGDCRTYVHIAGKPNFVDWLRGTDFFPEDIPGFVLDYAKVKITDTGFEFPLNPSEPSSRLTVLKGVVIVDGSGYDVTIPVREQ